MEAADNYQFNYDKLLRFLSRGAGGYVFVMADDFRFIPQINNSLVQVLEGRGLSAATVFLDAKSDTPLMYQIKEAASGRQALIVANLYEIINDTTTGRNNLLHLNFSREELQELPTALLFWADKISIGIISNIAVDLFSQRSLTTVHLTGTIEHPVAEVMQREDWQEFIGTERFKETEARIEILRRRLQDAEAAAYPATRIVEEIALPLAKEYAGLGIAEKATAILERYEASLNSDSYTQLEQIAHIYHSLHQYQQAIDYLQQANNQLKNGSFTSERWYVNILDIAGWMIEFGLLSEAREILLTSKESLTKETTDYTDKNFVKVSLNLLLDRLGTIELLLGKLQTAKNYYVQCLDIVKNLVETFPNDEYFRRDLSVSYNKLGDVFQLLGDIQSAKEYYESGLVIREELAKNNLKDEKLKRDLSISYNKLGDIIQVLGNIQAAKKFYEQGLIIREVLIRTNPHSEESKRDLSISYEKLGDITQMLGELHAAESYYIQSLNIAKELAEINPHNEQLKRDLGISYEKLGNVTKLLGNPQAAKNYSVQGLDVSKELVQANPHSEQLKRDLSISYNKLGDITRLLGELQAAKNYYYQGFTIREELAAANPHSEQLKRDLSISYVNQSVIAETENNYIEANKFLHRALIVLNQLSIANPLSQQLKNDISYVEEKKAKLQNVLENSIDIDKAFVS